MSELASYEFQLEQVCEALGKNPESAELIKLKADLEELISLYTLSASVEQKTESSSLSNTKRKQQDEQGKSVSPHQAWKVGDAVLAKYSVDGLYYKAVIDEIVALTSGVSYKVTYSDYGNSETVSSCNIKPLENLTHTLQPSAPKEAPKTKPKEPNFYAQKKAKVIEEEKIQSERQQSWQSFAKNTKKLKGSALNLKSKSIFATSDAGKVGVTGSGKGMTSFQHRNKHKYDDHA